MLGELANALALAVASPAAVHLGKALEPAFVVAISAACTGKTYAS